MNSKWRWHPCAAVLLVVIPCPVISRQLDFIIGTRYCFLDFSRPRLLCIPYCKYVFCFYLINPYFWNQATGYASQHIWCLSQARINWEGCARKGIWRKNGGDGSDGAPIGLDGVAVNPDCWYVCLCYLHCAPEDGEMYLLIPAHPGCPEQSPESSKMVVCCCNPYFRSLSRLGRG